MNSQFLLRSVASLAVLGAVLLSACGPEDAESAAAVNVAAAPAPAKVGREVCTDEVVTLKREPKDKDQIAGTVAGAVIGGVVGNQIGKGDGNKIATVAGAAAGGYAGNQIQEKAQKNNTYQETRRTCRMVYD